MAKYSLKLTKRYLRDLKLARKRGMDEGLLNEIIGKLLDGEPLPEKNHDHLLHGDYEGCRECHITPDWLLIYIKDTEIKIISLSRTGTHSDLFGKKNDKQSLHHPECYPLLIKRNALDFVGV